MTCKECEKFQEGDLSYFFDWKGQNIEIRCCLKHAGEIFDVLNKDKLKEGKALGK